MAAPPSVNRRVYFYRADAGIDETGRPLPLRVDAVLAAVDSLPFKPKGDGGRYLPLGDDGDLCAWVDDPDTEPRRLRLARLRRNALPQSEAGGLLTPVELAAGAALYEAVHLTFFPGNVIGAELNFYGPRPSRLPNYLAGVLNQPNLHFSMEQILRRDAAEQLERQRGLRPFDLEVRRSYVSTLAEADDSLSAALSATASVGDADLVGVVLKAAPRTRRARLGSSLLSIAQQMAGRSDLRENATHFRVTGVNAENRFEPIDVLSDALVSVQRVLRLGPKSRAVDPGSAYSAVSTAYTVATDQGLLDGPVVTMASN